MEEIAAVYSRSLFEVARERGSLDTIREQLGQFAELLEQRRDLQVFFFSPDFSTKEKQDGLERMLDGADPALMNFLKLLIEKHRMPVLFRARRQFDSLWEEENRMLPVEITSAVALDQEMIDRLGEQIGSQTARRVEVNSHVEPEILGGIVLRVGNSILDASVRNRIEQLRKQVA